MIRRNLSISSRGTSLNFRRHQGFTIVEVMMSIVLIAIGSALALPSYRNMVEKRQLTNSAEQLSSFVNTVQSISTRTNQIITVSSNRDADDDWCIGATMGDAACNCEVTDDSSSDYCEIDSQLFVLNQDVSGASDLMSGITGSGTYSFDPIRGLFLDLNDSITMEMHSYSGDFRLNMVVNNTGRVIVCSDDASHHVPGYKVCP